MAKLNKFLGTVEDTEAAFYDAISRADIEALMAIWAEDDEIICIHPGAPRLVGHAAIRTSWETIFERGGVHIQPVQLHAVQNMMSSVHNVVEEIKHPKHDPQELHIVATNVYIKTPHGWRIAVHHASVASGTAPDDRTAASMLH
jgi:ketosteroid isomerase-like protein